MCAALGQKCIGHAAEGFSDKLVALTFGLGFWQVKRLSPTPSHFCAGAATDFAKRIGAVIVVQIPKQKLLRMRRDYNLPIPINQRLPLRQIRMLRLFRSYPNIACQRAGAQRHRSEEHTSELQS